MYEIKQSRNKRNHSIFAFEEYIAYMSQLKWCYLLMA